MLGRVGSVGSLLVVVAGLLLPGDASAVTIADSFLLGDSYRMSSGSVIGYGTFFEWEQSPQAAAGRQCQG